MSVIVWDRVHMTMFDSARTAAPTVFDPIAARFTSAGIGLLATLRRDGSPRISPIEVTLTGGSLLVGMMPGSCKYHDLRRDPRTCLLTPVADRHDLGGEGKVFGRCVLVEAERSALFLAAAAEAAGVEPAELAGSPVFELDVEAAAWQWVEEDTFRTRSWTQAGGVRERGRTGALGTVVDLETGGPRT